MPAGTAWYHHDQPSSAVTIREAYFDHRGARHGTRKLSKSSRMALALTAACCELGKGKVFVLQPDVSDLSSRRQRLVEARAAFLAVPSLFFVPSTWSADEQARWTTMRPLSQLEELTSRSGVVPLSQSVLPIDVELSSEPEACPTLNGLKTATATIIIAPTPYAGLTQDMRAACGPVDVESLEFRCSSGWGPFQRWRRNDGLIGVVEELASMYHSGRAALAFFGSLRGRLIQANMAAAQAGQAYLLWHATEEE
ncbi:hypothetical protein AYL99_05180 [Fonsecaea erecta]|uniref:Uncharacterized protein n=1 Tax=Fonsecaea erecta TaxID=1367422 RepID=A0A178ZK54_9EURO|nr:hypothetical protein AYL99_05180 [Fonsecaea erecta]OAP60178.1 hypothetical protein AYL99_05180 [Fonsecaea erecta]